MKSGFYLSPDGMHILEIVQRWHFENEFMVYFNQFTLLDMSLYKAKIIFSSWEQLQ